MEPDSILVRKPKKVYSPLRYPGGKAILSDFFFGVVDRNNIVNCTYIEPFAGGAGAALTLLFLEKVDRIIINDLDIAIYSFWESILNDTDRFIDKLKHVAVTVDEWHIQKQIYQSATSSGFDRGFAAFFLNRTNHSGIIEGRPIGGLDQTGKWKIDARFNKDALIKRIRKISLYKNRIEVSNLDGIKLMQQVYALPNVLIYIDPPYYEKGSSLYLNHYDVSNHSELAAFLNNNSDIYWLLTYDNVPEITALYTERTKYTFDLYYHTNKPKKCKEILIKSDRLVI